MTNEDGRTTLAAQVEVRNVSKRFERPGNPGEEFVALKDVSFSIDEGEFIALIGASGCGKTTLLRMISGLTPFEEGSIHIAGTPVTGVPPAIGFVFQEPALLPSRTIQGNLRFALKGTSLSQEEVDARIANQLRLTRLEDFADYYPNALSGGMQQRVGLARALVCEPIVLVMDEPLSALDAFTRRMLQEDVGDIISKSRATTVLVTHEVDEAIFFGDRVIVMGSSPGSVQEIVDIPIERPRRHSALLGNPLVAQLRDKVLGIVLGTTHGTKSPNSLDGHSLLER